MNKTITPLSLAFTLAALSCSPALAQSWANGASDGNWGDTSSWTPATVPDAAGAVVNLTAALSTSQSQTSLNLGGNTYTLGILNIGNTAAGNAGYFGVNSPGNGGTLTFDNNGAGAQVNDVANAAGDQVNFIVFNLADNLSINDNQTTNAYTPLYGFEFGYGDATSITGTGNVSINDNNPVGSTISTGLAMGIYGDINNVGTLSFNGTGTGTVKLLGTIDSNVTEIDQNSATSDTDIDGGFSGTATLKITAGTVDFTNGGANYSTPSRVIVGDTAAHGSNSVLNINNLGNWTMGASQTLSGFGTVSSINTSNSVITVAGSMIAPGSVGHIGKLTLATNLTLAADTGLTFILGAPGSSSSLEIDRTLTLPSLQLNLSLVDNAGADSLGSLGDGTYELISYNALSGVASTGDITSLFNITAPAGYTYALSDTSITGPGQIDLTVSGGVVPEPGTWALLLGGLGLLGVLRKRVNRQD